MFDRAPNVMRTGRATIWTVACLFALVVSGCQRAETARAPIPIASPPSAAEPARDSTSSPHRDLAEDEAMGGHTLARHVGKTDDELRERLRREPDISSASSYTDQATAQAVVGVALSSAGRSFDAWLNRSGRRPNFVLHFTAGHPIGRSVGRRAKEPASCEDALVVVRWDDRRNRFYVLTSYPEARR